MFFQLICQVCFVTETRENQSEKAPYKRGAFLFFYIYQKTYMKKSKKRDTVYQIIRKLLINDRAVLSLKKVSERDTSFLVAVSVRVP